MKNFYYNITIVNKDNRDSRTVPVLLDVEYDCDEGANRELIVEMAVFKNFITKEDLEHICEVESMTYDEFVDLVEYNKEQYYVKRIKAVNRAYESTVEAAANRRKTDVDYFLQKHAEENAYFGIGDTLKVNNMNEYLKVKRISARLHYINNRIAIIYTGTYYRKVKGQMILLKGRKKGEGTISQANVTLYDAVIDKV